MYWIYGYSILVSYGDLDSFEGQELIGLGSSMANEVVNNGNACSLGSLSFENCALGSKFLGLDVTRPLCMCSTLLTSLANSLDGIHDSKGSYDKQVFEAFCLEATFL